MRKLMSAALALVLLVSLSACKTTGTPADTTATPAVVSTAALTLTPEQTAEPTAAPDPTPYPVPDVQLTLTTWTETYLPEGQSGGEEYLYAMTLTSSAPAPAGAALYVEMEVSKTGETPVILTAMFQDAAFSGLTAFTAVVRIRADQLEPSVMDILGQKNAISFMPMWMVLPQPVPADAPLAYEEADLHTLEGDYGILNDLLIIPNEGYPAQTACLLSLIDQEQPMIVPVFADVANPKALSGILDQPVSLEIVEHLFICAFAEAKAK